jgi:Tol biopolymer transport system component/uncharacterized membrane protein
MGGRSMAARSVVLLSVAALVLAGCYATRPLDWSPDGSRLAIGYGGQVYLVAADGSGVTRVTKGSVVSDGPDEADISWSPSGQSVAFTRGGSVWVVDVETGSERRLAAGTHPAWSPDARSIAYMVGGSVAEVWVVDAEGGSAPRKLGGLLAEDGDGMAWAPDGQRLAVCASDGLVVLDVAGAPDQHVYGEACAGSPDWSSDGRLVMAEERGLALLSPDLRSRTPLTSFDVGYVFSDRDPRWSPDGRRIAFTRWSGAAVVDVASGLVTTVGPADAEHPAWARDGLTLALARLDERGAAIYLVREGQPDKALVLSPTLRDERAKPGSSEMLRLPRGVAAAGTELVLIQRPLTAAVTLGVVAVDANGGPSVTFDVPAMPPAAYQLYLRGESGYAWVTELLVSRGDGTATAAIALIGLLAAALFAIGSSRAIRRWSRMVTVCGAGLLVGSLFVAVLAFPALLLLGAGLGANRFPRVARAHSTRGNVTAAVGALAACALIVFGLVAGAEPKPSREFNLDFAPNTFALVILGLIVMSGGLAWHAGHAIRRRDGNAWLEAGILVVALATVITLLSGGAHAASPMWPALVASLAVVTTIHGFDPTGERLRIPARTGPHAALPG